MPFAVRVGGLLAEQPPFSRDFNRWRERHSRSLGAMRWPWCCGLCVIVLLCYTVKYKSILRVELGDTSRLMQSVPLHTSLKESGHVPILARLSRFSCPSQPSAGYSAPSQFPIARLIKTGAAPSSTFPVVQLSRSLKARQIIKLPTGWSYHRVLNPPPDQPQR